MRAFGDQELAPLQRTPRAGRIFDVMPRRLERELSTGFILKRETETKTQNFFLVRQPADGGDLAQLATQFAP